MLALLLAAALAADPGAAADPIAEGIRLLDDGRYREAAEVLRAAQRGGPSADAALLEGICRYELGQDAEARRLLKVAEGDPAHEATARLYLGLLALRDGSAREATALFDQASASAPAAAIADELSRSSRWDGPLLLSLFAQGGWDSNVSLTSGGRGPSNKGDATGGVGALAIARPFGADGLFLRVSGGAQKYARLDAYDFAQVEGAVGARWWRGLTGVEGEYAYASRSLGGQAYLATHRLAATGSYGLGPVALTAAWQGRWDDYAPTWAAYTGFTQRADGRVSFPIGSSVRLAAGWTWGRDDARYANLSWMEQGPRAELRVALDPRTRITLEGGWASRTYDGFDAALGVQQQDQILDLGLALERDLGRNVTLRLGLLVRQSSSNVPGFDYTKIVPTAGIGVMMAP